MAGRPKQQLTVHRVRQLGKGRFGDGGGLYLRVRDDNVKSWVLRYLFAGKTREMGLGSAYGPSAVPLAEVRERAAELRRTIRQGTDPLAARSKAAQQRQAIAGMTFRTVAELYVKNHRAEWRDPRSEQQWANSLRDFVYEHIGALPVAEVDVGHVTAILEPIWTTKTVTATRVRGRIESILDFAKASGWRQGENPARWKGHLDHILASTKKVTVEHHAALPWRDIGAFMAKLRATQGIAASALRFIVLTASRSAETRGMRWREVDLANAVWTVPAERMKSNREHRVPLSGAALAVLREAAQLRMTDSPDELVFQGGRAGEPLDGKTLDRLLTRIGYGNVTVHGFRSTFRDWAGETGKANDIAEAALAHTLGNKTVEAYARGDLLQRRRRLMEEWAGFCGQPQVARGEVVQLRQA